MSAPHLAETPLVAIQHPSGCRDCTITIGGIERRMLSPVEVADRWGLSTRVIYRLIREKRMPTLNLTPIGSSGHGGAGDRYRISCCVVRELEASHDDPIPPQ